MSSLVQFVQDNWLLIVAIVTALVAASFLLIARRRRFRLSKVEVGAGPVKATLESPDAASAKTSPMISISKNKVMDQSSIEATGPGIDITDNAISGGSHVRADTTQPSRSGGIEDDPKA